MIKSIVSLLFLLPFFTIAPAGETVKPSGYPARPIDVIVPYAAGGGLDLSMRLLAKYAEVELGEKINVVNMTGGGNIQGNLFAIQAEPDGYVLGCWGMGLVTDELVIKNCPYSHNDVVPICLYSDDPHVITVSAAFAQRHGIATLRDLLEYVGKNAGKVTFGSGGNWTSHDFIRLKIETQAGVKFVRMPFLGGAPALHAAAEGNCDVVSPFVAEVIPHIDSGKVIPLAVTYPVRLSTLPDVPTTLEEGFPALTQTMWRVITVPKGTSQELIDYLGSVFQKASANPDYMQEAQALGVNPVFMGHAALTGFLEEEFLAFVTATEQWGIRVEKQ